MFRRPNGFRGYMWVRLALLASLVLAVTVFHASGSALVIFRIARLVLLGVLIGGGSWLLRRRRG